MNLIAVMLGRNVYAAALVVMKLEETCHLDRRISVWLWYDEDALCRVLATDQWIFRFGVKPYGPGEFAVIDPLT